MNCSSHNMAFEDNVSSFLSLLNLNAKACDDQDIAIAKMSKACMSFFMDIKAGGTMFHMFFLVTEDIMGYICPSMYPAMQILYGQCLEHENNVEVKRCSFFNLKKFWYNMAGICMFSFLDARGEIGDSLFGSDIPREISKNKSIEYIKKNKSHIVAARNVADRSVGLCVGMMMH